jgi:aspartyl-tRNA synthetase
MSFASAEDIMKITERIIQVLWETFFQENIFPRQISPEEYTMRDVPDSAPLYFTRVTYHTAMKWWGSDKPDSRLGAKLRQIQDFLDPTLKSKITSLKDPVVDIMRVATSSRPDITRKFITSFLEEPSAAPYMKNPHGSPSIFVFDPSKPMNGLSAFEHDAAEKIIERLQPKRGDLLVMQARPNRPFQGESSTMIGNLRRDLHMALQREGMIREPRRHEFCWVTDFPLFSRTHGTDPGQGGAAGIKSTHHPFTAPKTVADLDKLAENPLDCTGDHFDLVINGVEVGGGSRRIHDSKVQEMVLRDVLKVPEKQLEEFRPLLEALRAGCPPHAGIALGFDRLMAILRDAKSVRDVIVFPKTGNGEDKLAGAPSSISAERWAEYHMAVKGNEESLHLNKEKDESLAGSSEVEEELRSTAQPDPEVLGPVQPDESDTTPSTPS